MQGVTLFRLWNGGNGNTNSSCPVFSILIYQPQFTQLIETLKIKNQSNILPLIYLQIKLLKTKEIFYLKKIRNRIESLHQIQKA